MNSINYYLHKAYKPNYYQRQFEQDVQPKESDDSLIKRTALIALPFLSLYKPLGNTISITMGSIRGLNHFSRGFQITDPKREFECMGEMMQAALAGAAVAGSVWNFTLGLYLTTSVDLSTNLYHAAKCLQEEKYEQASEELMQAIGSSLYLSIMMTGSLEIVLASILLQASISFFQTRNEWKNGRIPEAIAKALMGSIRLYQAHNQYQLIQRRNELFAYQKYEELISRIQNGKKIDHLWDHPLVGLAKRIDGETVILTDVEGNEYDFGAHFHAMGKQIVKGMNIQFHQKNIDGKDITQLDFKVNHVFRDRLEKLLNDLNGQSKQDIQDLLKILGSRVEDISVQQTELSFEHDGGIGPAYQINLKGLGKIFIGSTSEIPIMHDRISVQMEKGVNLYDFHEILSYFSLDDVLRTSANEDIERMKMGQLFRIFFPKEATIFERSDAFFDLPFDQFNEKILEKCPEMKEYFKTYLPKMELREILPGRMRYAIEGLSDELKQYGARDISSALSGAHSTKEACKRIASILKMGMISSEMRFQNGMQQGGLSSEVDFYMGGADSIFTQMTTEKSPDYSELDYQGFARIVFSLKALETGTYQYHDDNFGTRLYENNPYWWIESSYLDRPNIVDFVKDENEDFNWDHEVMVKERIPPSYIEKILVNTESMKNTLIDYLRKNQMIQLDENGKETILGHLIEQFIQIE